jgi:hypothetical protein
MNGEAVIWLSLKRSRAAFEAASADAPHGCSSGDGCTCVLAIALRSRNGGLASPRPAGGGDGAGALSPPAAEETDENRKAQRARQVDLGRNSVCYMRYRWLVPRSSRGYRDPATPDVNRVYSKKAWDAVARRWRRQLHHFDLHRPWAADEGAGGGGREEEEEGGEEEELPVDTLTPAASAALATAARLTAVARSVPRCSVEVIDAAFGRGIAPLIAGDQRLRVSGRADDALLSVHGGGGEGEDSEEEGEDAAGAVGSSASTGPSAPMPAGVDDAGVRARFGADLVAVAASGSAAGSDGTHEAGAAPALLDALFARYHPRAVAAGMPKPKGQHGGRECDFHAIAALVVGVAPTFTLTQRTA